MSKIILDALPALAVCAAAIAAYWHSTGYYFSEDDFSFLARAKGLRPYPSILAPLGSRLLSARFYFQAMHELFGMTAGPYHWFSLLLHAVNAVLVYAVARVLTGGRLAAIAAGLIFATLDLSFTAVFWVSGVQDLLATAFMLATVLIWVASSRKGPITIALSTFTYALSLLSKETAVFLPALLALLVWAKGKRRARALVALIPHATLSAGAVALALVQSGKVPEGGAYETGITPHVFHNLATYVVWTVDVVHPFKDRVALISYDAWKAAVLAAGIVGILLITDRGKRGRIAWACLGWYALAIAPVLPLVRHTFLYYLYPAAPAAAILAGLVVGRVISTLSGRAGSRGVVVGWVLALGATAALCAIGIGNVRARENTKLPPDYKLPHDHVLRSAIVAGNASSTFADISLPNGADLLLINPYAPSGVDLVGELRSDEQRASYDLVKSVLRDGLVLQLFRPDLGQIHFAYRMEPRWENRHAVLYDAFGKLTYLGTGADIWANLSSVHLAITKRLEESVACSRRALELNPRHPRASLNLGIALAVTGSKTEAREVLERAAQVAPTQALRDQALEWLDSLDGGP